MAYPAPVARPMPAWLPAGLMGVVALVGLGCTLLPLWTVALNPADFQTQIEGMDEELPDSTIDVTIGFYDWGSASANSAAIALIPIALAVAVAIAVTLAVRAPDPVAGASDPSDEASERIPARTLWGAAAATVLSSLVLSLAVVLQPSADVDVTGELGRELSPRDIESVNPGSDLDFGYGAGLIVALVALVGVLGLAGWQYFTSGRPKRQRQQWQQPYSGYPPQPYGSYPPQGPQGLQGPQGPYPYA